MKIGLFSNHDRGDVVEGYRKFQQKFWPECQWPIEAIDDDTDRGWTKRLVGWLEKQTDPVVMMNGDDFWPFQWVEHEAVVGAAEQMTGNKKIVMTQLDYCHCSATVEPFKPLPRFDYYLPWQQEPMLWCGAGPQLVRVDYYLRLARIALSEITVHQDVGWGGMLFFESIASRHAPTLAKEGFLTLVSRKVAKALEGHGLAAKPVFGKLHTVRQGKWLEEARTISNQLMIDVDFSKRPFGDGSWGEAYRKWQASRE